MSFNADHQLRQQRFAQIGFILAILLLAFNLRGSLIVMGPLADTLSNELQLSGRSLGLLTTIPVFCFAVFSLFAAQLAQQFGIERILLMMLLLVCIGQSFRSTGHYEIMLIGTFVLGAAIAVMNVLTPSLVRRSFPSQIPLMTAMYTLVMSSGASLAAYSAIPIRDMASGDWRYAFGIWAIIAFISVLCWLPALRHRHVPATQISVASSMWKQDDAWWLSLFFGCQSFIFYTCTAWLAKLFIDAGTTEYDAGILLTLFNVFGTLASFFAPLIYQRFQRKYWPMLIVHLPMFVGLTGLILSTNSHPYLWAILMGLGQGSMLSLGLTLIASRAEDARAAAKLSGMCQAVGYTFAASGPIMIGAIHDWLASWHVPMLIFAVVIAMQFISALKASSADKIGV